MWCYYFFREKVWCSCVKGPHCCRDIHGSCSNNRSSRIKIVARTFLCYYIIIIICGIGKVNDVPFYVLNALTNQEFWLTKIWNVAVSATNFDIELMFFYVYLLICMNYSFYRSNCVYFLIRTATECYSFGTHCRSCFL